MSAAATRPASPGPGPVPPEVLRALDLTVRRRIHSLLPGSFRTSALGEGTELAQVRPYVPGDDVRRIDWNVTARTREPHVRLQVAERSLTTWLVLDASASMSFGTADRLKSDVAAGASLAVAHLATKGGNRLGLVTFGSPEPARARPLSGRRGLLGALAAIGAGAEHSGDGPGLADALRGVDSYALQRGLVVVVSDLRGPLDWEGPLLRLRRRHAVVVLEVRDRREQALPAVGHLWLVDPETGRQLHVDTGSRKLRERFAARAAEEREQVARLLRRAGAAHAVLSTSGDWLRDLAGFLRREARRR